MPYLFSSKLTYHPGHQVNLHFFRALARKVHYSLLHFSRRPGGNSLGTAFRAVEAAEAAEAIRFFDTRRVRSDFVRTLLKNVPDEVLR